MTDNLRLDTLGPDAIVAVLSHLAPRFDCTTTDVGTFWEKRQQKPGGVHTDELLAFTLTCKAFRAAQVSAGLKLQANPRALLYGGSIQRMLWARDECRCPTKEINPCSLPISSCLLSLGMCGPVFTGGDEADKGRLSESLRFELGESFEQACEQQAVTLEPTGEFTPTGQPLYERFFAENPNFKLKNHLKSVAYPLGSIELAFEERACGFERALRFMGSDSDDTSGFDDDWASDLGKFHQNTRIKFDSQKPYITTTALLRAIAELSWRGFGTDHDIQGVCHLEEIKWSDQRGCFVVSYGHDT